MSYYTHLDFDLGNEELAIRDLEYLELCRRNAHPTVRRELPPRGKSSEYYCESCGKVFTARKADRARGWAMCCSKSCAAARRTYGGDPGHVRHGLKAKVSRNAPDAPELGGQS